MFFHSISQLNACEEVKEPWAISWLTGKQLASKSMVRGMNNVDVMCEKEPVMTHQVMAKSEPSYLLVEINPAGIDGFSAAGDICLSQRLVYTPVIIISANVIHEGVEKVLSAVCLIIFTNRWMFLFC